MIKANTKVHAAIIIIGNEILSGRTQDTNVKTISLWLGNLGVRLDEVRIIPDEEKMTMFNKSFVRLSTYKRLQSHTKIKDATITKRLFTNT